MQQVKRMQQLLLSTVAVTVAFVALSGQEVQPTCTMCPGAYIAKSEVDAYVKRAIANRLVDQQIRAVDVGKANVGIGVVYRGRLANPEPNIAEHDLISELYHIIEGSATLVLGGDLAGMERRPATAKTVRVQNGPRLPRSSRTRGSFRRSRWGTSSSNTTPTDTKSPWWRRRVRLPPPGHAAASSAPMTNWVTGASGSRA